MAYIVDSRPEFDFFTRSTARTQTRPTWYPQTADSKPPTPYPGPRRQRAPDPRPQNPNPESKLQTRDPGLWTPDSRPRDPIIDILS